MVDLAEDAIGKPVYLYSHKMTMKQPNEGGAWEWHQDSDIGTTTVASRPT